MLAVILYLPALGGAQSLVDVPVGTKVALRLLGGLDSTTAAQDQRVSFRVAASVSVNRRIVLREGTAAHGVVVSVVREASPEEGPRIRIAFVETTAVDGSVIRLTRIDATPGSLRQVRDLAAVAATSPVGTILYSNGATVAALSRGGHVVVPAGAVVVTATTHAVQINTE